MKFKLSLLFLTLSFIFLVSCSNEDDELKPPDYSNMIKGDWEGVATTERPDTLLFDMTLDAVENNVTGISKFVVNGVPEEDLTVTGTIDNPKVNLKFTSSIESFTFNGNFSATNDRIMSGTLNNEEYNNVPVTFTRK